MKLTYNFDRGVEEMELPFWFKPSIVPDDIAFSIRELDVDWDDPSHREEFCNYIEQLQSKLK